MLRSIVRPIRPERAFGLAECTILMSLSAAAWRATGSDEPPDEEEPPQAVTLAVSEEQHKRHQGLRADLRRHFGCLRAC
jgi:hypothetical protein